MTLPAFKFQDRPLSVVYLEDAPYFIAKEVGNALGYADDGAKLIDCIRQNWSDELIDGRHLLLLDGERLASLKLMVNIPANRRDVVDDIPTNRGDVVDDIPTNRGDVVDDIPANRGDVIPSQTARLLLLTEQGLYRVLMLAGGPVALRFRDWLDTEVLPTLRRTGQYTIPGTSSAQRDHGIGPADEQLLALAMATRDLRRAEWTTRHAFERYAEYEGQSDFRELRASVKKMQKVVKDLRRVVDGMKASNATAASAIAALLEDDEPTLVM